MRGSYDQRRELCGHVELLALIFGFYLGTTFYKKGRSRGPTGVYVHTCCCCQLYEHGVRCHFNQCAGAHSSKRQEHSKQFDEGGVSSSWTPSRCSNKGCLYRHITHIYQCIFSTLNAAKIRVHFQIDPDITPTSAGHDSASCEPGR